MRFLKPVCLLLFILLNAHVYSQCVSAPVTVLSGETCINSMLTVKSNIPLSSISWTLDGNTIRTETARWSSTAETVAGYNGEGGSQSQFANPDRMFMDVVGNLFVADLGNARIQVWTPGAPQGATVAGGNGVGRRDDQFDRPTSVFVDEFGNIFVADQSNNRIQKWARYATTGVTVASDINQPTDVFVDHQGNIYASDQANYLVKKWSPGNPTGVVIAGGTYGSGPANFASATGIYVDEAGNLYVCDTDNNRVQKWAPGATQGVTVAGGNGSGSNANQLNNPLDVFVDCFNNVFVADFNNNRVQLWRPGATSGITLMGSATPGNNNISFNGPVGIVVNPQNNEIFVSDFYNHRVQRISYPLANTHVADVAGVYQVNVTPDCCPLTSNTIAVSASKTAKVSITANPEILCTGTAVTFSATAEAGGSSPSFQWKKNGINTGTNNAVYTDNNIRNGDRIICVLTSDDRCATPLNPVSNELTMKTGSAVAVSLGADRGFCPGSSLDLAPAGNFVSYLWQDGSTAPSLAVTNAGSYAVTVVDACGVSSGDEVTVVQYAVTKDLLPAEKTICSYETAELSLASTFKTYQWSTSSSSPSIRVTLPGTYWLQVTDQHDCISSDTIVIKTATACLPKGFYVPGAFSPQNDGLNDLFLPTIAGTLSKYQFSIYNRNGQLVFRSTDPSRGWDGKYKGQVQDNNVFVWSCSYQLINEPALVVKGTVTLVR